MIMGFNEFGPVYAPADEGAGGGDAGDAGEGTDGTEGTEGTEAAEAGGEATEGKQLPGNSAFANEGSEGESEGGEETPPDEGPAERPSFLKSDKFWNAETGEVDVEKLANAYEASQARLREKLNVPEVTDENPYGYDMNMLYDGIGEEGEEGHMEGLGFPENWHETEEAQAFFQRKLDQGASTEQVYDDLRDFRDWKENYDKAMGYGIDHDVEAREIEDHFIRKYGERDAKKNYDAVMNFIENTGGFEDDMKRAMLMTAAGLRYADGLLQAKVKANPVTNEEKSLSNQMTGADVNKQIAKMMNDPRGKLPVSDPERKAYEAELDRLYQEREQLGEGNPVGQSAQLNPNHPSNAPERGSVEDVWGAEDRRDGKHRRRKY